MAHLTPHTLVPNFGLTVYGDDLHGNSCISFELQMDCMPVAFHLTPDFWAVQIPHHNRFEVTPDIRALEVQRPANIRVCPGLDGTQARGARRKRVEPAHLYFLRLSCAG